MLGLKQIIYLLPLLFSFLTFKVYCGVKEIFVKMPIVKVDCPAVAIKSAEEVNASLSKKGVISCDAGTLEAVVFKVERDSEEMVLRLAMGGFLKDINNIEEQKRTERLLAQNKLIKRYFGFVQNLCPNVVKVYDSFYLRKKETFSLNHLHNINSLLWPKIKGEELIPLDQETSEDCFVNYYHLTLMERLDQASLNSSKLAGVGLHFRFVSGYLDLLNKRLGVRWENGDLNNWGYVETKKDTFLGKKVSDYKYWHYQIPGYNVYLPIGQFTFKRFDPGHMLALPSAKNLTVVDSEKLLESTLKEFNDESSKEEALKRITTYPEGVSDTEILHVPVDFE